MIYVFRSQPQGISKALHLELSTVMLMGWGWGMKVTASEETDSSPSGKASAGTPWQVTSHSGQAGYPPAEGESTEPKHGACLSLHSPALHSYNNLSQQTD